MREFWGCASTLRSLAPALLPLRPRECRKRIKILVLHSGWSRLARVAGVLSVYHNKWATSRYQQLTQSAVKLLTTIRQTRTSSLVQVDTVIAPEWIPDDVSGLQLDALHLIGSGFITSGFRINPVPLPIFSCISLTCLNLSCNKLVSISGIRNLVNLKLLNVSGNRLDYLPDDLCDLKQLVDFNCSNNQLTSRSFPIALFDSTLTNLDISNNQVSDVSPRLISLSTGIAGLKLHCNKWPNPLNQITEETPLESIKMILKEFELKHLAGTQGVSKQEHEARALTQSASLPARPSSRNSAPSEVDTSKPLALEGAALPILPQRPYYPELKAAEYRQVSPPARQPSKSTAERFVEVLSNNPALEGSAPPALRARPDSHHDQGVTETLVQDSLETLRKPLGLDEPSLPALSSRPDRVKPLQQDLPLLAPHSPLVVHKRATGPKGRKAPTGDNIVTGDELSPQIKRQQQIPGNSTAHESLRIKRQPNDAGEVYLK